MSFYMIVVLANVAAMCVVNLLYFVSLRWIVLVHGTDWGYVL